MIREPEVIKLCPLEAQIKAMASANSDMKDLLLSYQNEDQALNSLTMRLNGTIDAAVNGGTANYEKSFFTDEYLREHPEHQDKILELKQHIANQIPLLSLGLAIHDEKKSEAMKPLHDRLAAMFKTMEVEVEQKYGKGECDLDQDMFKRFSMVSKFSEQNSLTPPNRDSCEDTNTLRRPSSHHTSNVSLMNGSANDVDMRNKSSIYLNTSNQNQSVRASNYTERVGEYMRIGMKTVGRRKSNAKTKEVEKMNIRSMRNHSSTLEEDSSNGGIGIKLIPPNSGSNSSRPSSGQFLASTPNHSRSPSHSNRGSMTSNDGSFYESQLPHPPPVPPKNLKGNLYGDEDSGSLVSVEENNIINRSQNNGINNHNASNSLSQEYIVDLHNSSSQQPIIRHSKKKAPPPPPPLIEFQDEIKTPPTPPKKPPIKLPID